MVDLPKNILTTTGFLLSTLLVSCTIQKRTLQPGFHVKSIGALNKKPSLQMKAQETAQLPVLPNESAGLSYHPTAFDTFNTETNPVGGHRLKDLPVADPRQSIESSSQQRELCPVRFDSTSTSVIESQVPPSDDAELMAKIAKAKEELKIHTNLLLLTSPLIFTIPLFMLLRSKKKSQIAALQKEANLPYKLAWYNTTWFLVSLILYPILPFALTCRLIDRRRMKNGKEPMSWKSKNLFFTFLIIFLLLLLLGGGGFSIDLNLAF